MRLYNFDKVITPTKMYVVNALVREFPKFSIMSGDSGTGKSTCAEISALRLTCLEPNGYNPCGKCLHCRTGIEHIEGKGNSLFVRKINIAKMKGNINEIIDQIFNLATSSNVVYILEEVHSLSVDAQTSLLEEIDKTPEGVYIIMCTTRVGKLLPELRGRAIHFKFKSLNKSNSRMLLDVVMNSNHISLPAKSQELIIDHAKGSPRVLTMLVDFVYKNGYDYDELLGYLDEIDYRIFTELLSNVGSVTNYMSLLNDMLSNYDRDSLIRQFKGYLLDASFMLKSAPKRDLRLTAVDNRFLSNLKFSTVANVYSKLMNMTIDNDDDFLFFMVFVLRPSIAKELGTVSNASTEHIASKSLRQDVVEESFKEDVTPSTKLSKVSFDNLIK